MTEKSAQLAEIGKQLRFWRKKRGLTLQQLADLVHSNPSNLAKLEKGTAGLSLSRFEQVAAALNVPIALLISPTMPFAVVGGTVTGTGYWLDKFPIADGAKARIVLMPHAVDAGAAFVHEMEILFCGSQIDTTPFSKNPGVLRHGHRYVVLRKYDFSSEGNGRLHYELALRMFNRPPVEMGNALSRAATSGTPATTPKKLGPMAAAMGDTPGAGWFTVQVPEDADPRIAHAAVIESDRSIVAVWPLRASFQVYPKG